MIGTLTYEEITAVIEHLKKSNNTLNDIFKDKNVDSMHKLVDNTTKYISFLENYLTISKDADIAVEINKNFTKE